MNPRLTSFILAFSMLVMGICGICYEYVLSILGNYLMGSSHEELIVIIGIMMFAMGVGSYIQQVLGGNLLNGFLVIELLLGVIGGFSGTIVYYVFAVSESYRAVLYGFAFLIGSFIGMEIPILIRINQQIASSLKANLSGILSMDYVGSLVGALLFAYVFLTRVELTRISYLMGIANCLVAGLGLFYFRTQVSRPWLQAAMVFAGLGGLVWGFYQAPSWSAWAEQRYFADPIVLRETSKYQHIVLTQRNGVVNLYLNGHLQFSSKDEAIYHESLVHPAAAIVPSRERVLILGGGDGLAVRECLKYPDVESVVVVDIDRRVLEIAAEHPLLTAVNEHSLLSAKVATLEATGLSPSTEERPVNLRSQRSSRRYTDVGHLGDVKIYQVDAEKFLEQFSGEFDLVLIDLPDPSRVEISKLYTVSFYRKLKALMANGAVLAIQSTSPFHAQLVFNCIGKTLSAAGFAVVPFHVNVPSFGEWGFHIAVPGSHAGVLKERLQAVERFEAPTRFLTAELFRGCLSFGKGWVDWETVEVNSRLRPVVVKYYDRSWTGY